MDITTEPIAAVKGKGRDDKCEVVGQHSFTSPTGCRLSAVARVCEVLWQATATDNLMPVSWLWCQSSVRLPLTKQQQQKGRLQETTVLLNLFLCQCVLVCDSNKMYAKFL